MKTNLATTIFAAVLGVFVAYFVCSLFIGEIDPVSVKVVDDNVSTSLAEPNDEVFNYRALNPTVEVFVGACSDADSDGDCANNTATEELENLETDDNQDSDNSNNGNDQENS